MINLRLILDENSITHRKGTNEDVVYGNMYFDLNENFYPMKDWNEYIYRVLITWTYNIINYNEYELCFMDGPYGLSYVIDGEFIFVSIEEYGKYKCLLYSFLDDVISCLQKLETHMKRNDLNNKQIHRVHECLILMKQKQQSMISK